MIKFSRHAKRRMMLYKLQEEDVIEVIKKGNKESIGNNNFSFIASLDDFNYPIKAVCKVTGNDTLVITNYPLKKGWKDENKL